MDHQRTGSRIELHSGGEAVEGYLSIPAGGAGRGVLVLHGARGLTDHPRDVCDRLAREGFVAMAPDLLRGGRAADEDEAERLTRELDTTRTSGLLDAALTALVGHHAVVGSRVGAIGFELGGPLALLAAARSHRVAAVVDFYGFHPDLEIEFAKITAPVLGIFAEGGPRMWREQVQELEAILREAGARAHVELYPDVQAGFMDDSRADRYDARAAQKGWDALLTFLRAGLA